MNGFKIYQSNRNDLLAAELAYILKKTPRGPFCKETVIVQSQGMAHWLRLKLADANGICANIEFPFPKAFVEGIFSQLCDFPDYYPFNPEIMLWKLMRIIPEKLEEPVFAPVKNYISGGAESLKIYQLASRLAYLFDQYQVYRPDFITDWERGTADTASSDAQWQTALWREISASDRRLSYPALMRNLEMSLQNIEVPERIFVFGISTLPPFYVDAFKIISRRSELHFFYMNPCAEYWAEQYSPKEIERLRKDSYTEEELYLCPENNLLASYGRSGREFFNLMLSTEPLQEKKSFKDPGDSSMLKQIQRDILELKGGASEKSDEAQKDFSQDDSIQIHSCYSPLRELEVLRDNIIGLFDRNAGLTPDDIIVMMPDISVYALLIDSVFGAGEKPVIPYSIADRRMNESNVCARVLLSIFRLLPGKFSAPEIMDILSAPPVMKKFSLASADIQLIKKWITRTGIRWGVDEEQRSSAGFEHFRENSWMHGLDQLLAGYALSNYFSDETDFFEDIVPFDDIESDNVNTLASFSSFLKTLFRYTEMFSKQMSPDAWAAAVSGLIDEVFPADEEYMDDVKELREIIGEKGLAAYCEAASFESLLKYDLIYEYLKEHMGHPSGTRGFLRGGLTFCTMLPMRSIPFKAVFLLGLDSSAFPGRDAALPFDLMRGGRRLCDPSRRDSDRYLFLEAMLAAEQYFILSYIGRNIKENTVIPPSGVLSELTDYISAHYKTGSGFFREHPLQAFSIKYFKNDSGFFSYSAENYRVASASLDRKFRGTFLPDGKLPVPLSYPKETGIYDLVNFFKNPCKHLIRKRLGINLEQEESLKLSGDDDFLLDNLQTYNIKEYILNLLETGRSPDNYFKTLRCQGILPYGTSGETVFNDCKNSMQTMFDDACKIFKLDDNVPVNIYIDINLSNYGNFRLNAFLNTVYPEGQLFLFPTKLKAKRLLDAWIRHLALNADPSRVKPCRTHMFFEKEQYTYESLGREAAEAELSNLLELFLRGFSEIIPFLPDLSWGLFNSKNPEAGWKKFCESYKKEKDEYVEMCFSGRALDQSAFSAVGERVFRPLITARNNL